MTLKSDIASDFDIALTDLPAAVIYKRKTGESFDPSTGTTTPTFSETNVNAIRANLSARQVAISNGLFIYGDVLFYIKVSDLTAEPANVDQIVDGSENFKIEGFITEEDENVYCVIARRI